MITTQWSIVKQKSSRAKRLMHIAEPREPSKRWCELSLVSTRAFALFMHRVARAPSAVICDVCYDGVCTYYMTRR